MVHTQAELEQLAAELEVAKLEARVAQAELKKALLEKQLREARSDRSVDLPVHKEPIPTAGRQTQVPTMVAAPAPVVAKPITARTKAADSPVASPVVVESVDIGDLFTRLNGRGEQFRQSVSGHNQRIVDEEEERLRKEAILREQRDGLGTPLQLDDDDGLALPPASPKEDERLLADEDLGLTTLSCPNIAIPLPTAVSKPTMPTKSLMALAGFKEDEIPDDTAPVKPPAKSNITVLTGDVPKQSGANDDFVLGAGIAMYEPVPAPVEAPEEAKTDTVALSGPKDDTSTINAAKVEEPRQWEAMAPTKSKDGKFKINVMIIGGRDSSFNQDLSTNILKRSVIEQPVTKIVAVKKRVDGEIRVVKQKITETKVVDHSARIMAVNAVNNLDDFEQLANFETKVTKGAIKCSEMDRADNKIHHYAAVPDTLIINCLDSIHLSILQGKRTDEPRKPADLHKLSDGASPAQAAAYRQVVVAYEENLKRYQTNLVHYKANERKLAKIEETYLERFVAAVEKMSIMRDPEGRVVRRPAIINTALGIEFPEELKERLTKCGARLVAFDQGNLSPAYHPPTNDGQDHRYTYSPDVIRKKQYDKFVDKIAEASLKPVTMRIVKRASQSAEVGTPG